MDLNETWMQIHMWKYQKTEKEVKEWFLLIIHASVDINKICQPWGRDVCINIRNPVFWNTWNFTIEHQCIYLLLIHYVTMQHRTAEDWQNCFRGLKRKNEEGKIAKYTFKVSVFKILEIISQVALCGNYFLWFLFSTSELETKAVSIIKPYFQDCALLQGFQNLWSEKWRY